MRALMGRWERFRRAISEALLWGRRKGENAEKMGYSLFKSAVTLDMLQMFTFSFCFRTSDPGWVFEKGDRFPPCRTGLLGALPSNQSLDPMLTARNHAPKSRIFEILALRD